MSVAQFAMDSKGFLPLTAVPGLSEEARLVRDHIDQVLVDRFSSISLGQSYKAALQALQSVFEECSVENWDGYEAEAVDPITYSRARDFLQALPTNWPKPQVSGEPDGEISLEWFRGPRQVFSVSIGRDNELAFAGIFGRTRVHGTTYFADEIPEIISENLDRIYPESSGATE